MSEPLNPAPSSEERQVKSMSVAAIDGTPVAYIVSLAAVVAVLAMIPIPISVVLGSGRNFPMSQSIYPLVGWLLGPIAGALADGIGALIGVIIAPHTTSSAPATIFGAAMGGLAAGAMVNSGARRYWWIPLSLLFAGLYVLYAGRAVWVNQVSWTSVLLGSFINWSALLLFVLPTRTVLAGFLQASEMKRVGAGLFVGTWMIAGLVHLSTGAIVYTIINWPNELWLAIAPLAPIEHLIRCIAGTGIGLGVIGGLRATGLVKPLHARY
ncbi:MAG: hypothetical protein ACP5HG_00420 [Anaerolineae bacterium]